MLLELKTGDILQIEDLQAEACFPKNEKFFCNLYKSGHPYVYENHIGQLYLKPSRSQVLLFLSGQRRILNRSQFFEFDIDYFFDNITIIPAPVLEKECSNG